MSQDEDPWYFVLSHLVTWYLVHALRSLGLTLDVELLPIGIALISRNRLVRYIDRNLTFYIKVSLCLNGRRGYCIAGNLCQFGAERETVVVDSLNRCRKGHVLQIGTTIESTLSNAGDAIRDTNERESSRGNVETISRVYAYKKPEIVYSCMPCPSIFILFLGPGKTKKFLNDCAYFTALNDMSSDL